MAYHFRHEINGPAAWGEVFCDPEAFAGLAQAIFLREGIPCPGVLTELTPGTNAVFRAGAYVIKLFAPEASGLGTEADFRVEAAMLRHAQSLGIAVSGLVAEGCLRDRYIFRYMILRHVEGREAGGALGSLTAGERRTFIQQLRDALWRLNQPCTGVLPKTDLLAQAVANERLTLLPDALAEALRARARRADLRHPVLTHGDITGENVLITKDGRPVLIDFADSRWAPACYELPPLLFELFRHDKELVTLWRGEQPLEAFVRDVLDGLSLHAFGPDIMRGFARRTGVALEDIGSLEGLEEILGRLWA